MVITLMVGFNHLDHGSNDTQENGSSNGHFLVMEVAAKLLK